jgi:hypothetical protein
MAFRWTAGLRLATLIGALLVLASFVVNLERAQAHFDGFTDNQTYDCSGLGAGGGCWQDGDAIGGNSPQAHSYGFQSVENRSSGSRQVSTVICDSSFCFVNIGFDFRRLCYPPWRHSSDELDCHDQDGTSFSARIIANDGGSIRGFAHW